MPAADLAEGSRSRDNSTMPAIDDTIRRSLLSVAGELQSTMASIPAWAAPGGVGESDLQRAMCNAIQSNMGAVAAIEGPLPAGVKDCWAGWLGRVDVLAKPEESGEVYIETKLCLIDKLYEAVWDVLKVALVTALVQDASGYVLYAAPQEGWTPREDRPVEIFGDTALTVSELLRERFPDAWAWCLDGTKTTRPISLPAEIRTERIGSARIQSPRADWEIRCIRVEGDSRGGWVSFDSEGWPE